MKINDALLKILACPESHQPVAIAPDSLIEKLNKQIDEKTLLNRAQKPVVERCDSGLLRKDGKVLYPIRQGIPVMLIEEAIDL